MNTPVMPGLKIRRRQGHRTGENRTLKPGGERRIIVPSAAAGAYFTDQQPLLLMTAGRPDGFIRITPPFCAAD